MKKFKGNKGLLDKKRFEWLENERIQRLRKLTRKEAIRLEEKMLSSKLILEWRKNFGEDPPVCLKMSLRNKRGKQ